MPSSGFAVKVPHVGWNDIIAEKAAWDIFLWYGGLIRLGKALNEQGVSQAFANGVGGTAIALLP